MPPLAARIFTVAAACAAVVSLAADDRTDPLAFLLPDVAVTDSERAQLDAGKTLVRVLPGRDGFLSLLAIGRVGAEGERLLSWSRRVETLLKGKYVPEVGRFSMPPRLDDLRGLTLDRAELDALERCRPGRCGLKLSNSEIDRLALAGNRHEREALFRGFLIERAAAYAAHGDAAMLPYHDHKTPVHPQEAFAAVLRRLRFLPTSLGCCAEYLLRYPRAAHGHIRDSFLYWSKEELGMKPIISITHVTALQLDAPHMPQVAVLAKQVYANHYKDASLTITALTGDARNKYLVYVHQSSVDAFGGAMGGLVRRVVERRVKAEAPGVLLGFRKRLESGPPDAVVVETR